MKFYFANDFRDFARNRFRVSVVADVFGWSAVIHPHQITARALRHHRDESVGGSPFRRIQQRANFIAKAPVVIGRQQWRAVIMLGIIREQCQRFAVQRLHREHGQTRVHGARRANGIWTFVAGMHVRANVLHAERVDEHFVGTTNPATVEGVFPIIDHAPTDTSGLQIFHRADDRLRHARHEKHRVVCIHAAAETTHRRGSGMRVRCRNKHFVRGNSGGFARLIFRAIHQVARHHASIDDGDDEARRAVIQGERADVKSIHRIRRRAFGEHGIDEHGKIRRRDVHDAGAGAECFALRRVRDVAQSQEQSEKRRRGTAQSIEDDNDQRTFYFHTELVHRCRGRIEVETGRS